MGDNVVYFPVGDRDPETPGMLPSTVEEMKASIQAVRHVHVNEITEVITGTLVQQMMVGGFDILDESRKKDYAFMIETVRSTLCSTLDIYHPFRAVAEQIMEETPDPAVLRIADKIAVNFQDDESNDDEPEAEAGT
jgi:hypothetical protein